MTASKPIPKPGPKPGPKPPAAPRVSGAAAAAPRELVDDDEWIGVTATEDYIGQRVEALEASDVQVVGGRWSGVIVERLRATDVVFRDCDLAGFVLQSDSSLRRVSFTRCRLLGAVFAGVYLGDVSFTECALDEANFRMSAFERVAFDGCGLASADFYAAKMTDVRVALSDMTGVELSKAALVDVDLRTSQLEDLRGAEALRGATIDSTQIIGLARSLAVALGLHVVDPE